MRRGYANMWLLCIPVTLWVHACMCVLVHVCEHTLHAIRPSHPNLQTVAELLPSFQDSCCHHGNDVSWRLSSIPVCIFCGCVRSCMGFFSSGIYNWFMVKSAWLCIVSAVCLYYRSCFDDLRNKVEMGNSPAFRILYTHLPFSKTDLFGCFYVG